MNINEQSIEELTKLLIKEQFEEKEKIIKISKKDLIRFCIKLLKVIERCK